MTVRRALLWIVGAILGAALLYVGYTVAANYGIDIHL